MSEISKDRIKYIDAIKGFTILLVLIGHSLMSGVKDYNNNFLFRVIYSFHMPLFMFISGYLIHFGINSDFFKFIKNKFNHLIIPIVSWWFIHCLILKFLNWDISIISKFKLIIMSPPEGLWFLAVLFFSCLALAISVKLSKILNIFAYLFIFLLIRSLHIYIFWYSRLKWYYLFFLMGYLISNYFDIFNKKYSPYLFFSGILYPFLFKGWNQTKASSYIYLHSYFLPFCAIFSIFCLFQKLDKYAKDTRIYGLLCWLGLYTYDIYVIHMGLFSELGFGQGIIQVIALTMVYLFGALLVSKVLRKSKLLSFLLLGIKKQV